MVLLPWLNSHGDSRPFVAYLLYEEGGIGADFGGI